MPVTTPPSLPGELALWLFDEGSGHFAKNHFASVPYSGTNRITAPEQAFGDTRFWTKASTTVTEAAGNNQDGLPIATRLQINTGGLIYPAVNLGLAAGQYTFSIWLRSNTGLSQGACIGFHTSTTNGPVTNNITVTTTWTQHSVTLSPATGTITLIYLYAASNNLDVLCGGYQFEPGATASTYVSPEFDFFYGGGTTSPTWSSEGITADATDIGIAKSTSYPTFAEMSGYMCIRVDDASQSRISIRDNLSAPAASPGFTAGTINSQGANRQGIVAASSNLRVISPVEDSKYHVIAWTWDGTTLRYYLDGTFLYAVAASTGWTSAGFLLGDGSVPFVGKRGPHAIYTEAHTAAQVRQMTDWIASEMAARSVTVNDLQTVVCFEGDSISELFGDWAAYSFTFQTLQELIVHGVSHAVSGSTNADVSARAATVDLILESNKQYPIISEFWGTNDLAGADSAATVYANYKARCQARIAAGWFVMGWTVMPRDVVGFEAKRLAFNTLVRTNGVAEGWLHHLCDVGADATLGDEDNLATAFLDGIHPDEAGHTILKNYAVTGIEAILAMDPMTYPEESSGSAWSAYISDVYADGVWADGVWGDGV